MSSITLLQDEYGTSYTNSEEIHKLAAEFYQDLFTSESPPRSLSLYNLNTKRLSTIQRNSLDMEFLSSEVKDSVFSIKGNKAPGPDGMSGKFFQHYWDIVGSDLTAMVLNFLNNRALLHKFNFTLITLVPKIKNPITMTNFRPIALCKTVAKVIAKCLATRLKNVLPTIISESQNAFVANRVITDNVLLSYEIHHFIKHKKTGRE
ncbi:hypothetical protein LIER_32949 [Lithospermum erythrorhizon]|uniref:Reverse transcriptase domain-containing protein n=1 Tax=Lithospermum erythrorhizon TaxID=34254 RepID=A0AAV3RV89_LITER